MVKVAGIEPAFIEYYSITHMYTKAWSVAFYVQYRLMHKTTRS